MADGVTPDLALAAGEAFLNSLPELRAAEKRARMIFSPAWVDEEERVVPAEELPELARAAEQEYASARRSIEGTGRVLVEAGEAWGVGPESLADYLATPGLRPLPNDVEGEVRWIVEEATRRKAEESRPRGGPPAKRQGRSKGPGQANRGSARLYLSFTDMPHVSSRVSPFYCVDSMPMGDRLLKMLRKRHGSGTSGFSLNVVKDEDAQILWDESVNRIKGLSASAIYCGLAEVPQGMQPLVQFHEDCERWEKVIREREAAKQPDVGPFYLVLEWFEEGYEGTYPVYRTADRAIAEELIKAAQERFGTRPHDIEMSGFYQWFKVVAADEAPSRILWDTDMAKLEHDSSDPASPFFKACAEWETKLRLAGRAAPSTAPRAGADTTPVVQTRHHAIAPPRPRLTRSEANIEARTFLQRNPRATARQVADGIGCALGLIPDLPAWKAVQEQRAKRRLPRKTAVVSLTSKLEGAAGSGRKDEVLEQLIREQEADAEPSPLSAEPPEDRDGRPRTAKVYGRR